MQIHKALLRTISERMLGLLEGEFLQDAHSMFSDIVPVRSDYMRLKYGKHVSVINALIRLRLDAYLFPSNYFICRRAE